MFFNELIYKLTFRNVCILKTAYEDFLQETDKLPAQPKFRLKTSGQGVDINLFL